LHPPPPSLLPFFFSPPPPPPSPPSFPTRRSSDLLRPARSGRRDRQDRDLRRQLRAPVQARRALGARRDHARQDRGDQGRVRGDGDRKSTRLNSSHDQISYAVFCLKKKKKKKKIKY